MLLFFFFDLFWAFSKNLAVALVLLVWAQTKGLALQNREGTPPECGPQLHFLPKTSLLWTTATFRRPQLSFWKILLFVIKIVDALHFLNTTGVSHSRILFFTPESSFFGSPFLAPKRLPCSMGMVFSWFWTCFFFSDDF